MMSSTALFEFDIDLDKITPEDLSVEIYKIVGTENCLSDYVDLVSKEDLKKRTNNLNSPDFEIIQKISDQFVKDIEEMVSQNFPDVKPCDDSREYTRNTSTKKWELVIGYYDDDEFLLFEQVVSLLLENTIGDVFYFREPQAQGNDEYRNAKEISITDLKNYTPDMSEFDTYVFKKH